MEKLLGSLLVVGLALPWYVTQKATGSVPAGFSAGLGGLALAVLVLLWLSAQRDRYQAGAQRRRDLDYLRCGLAELDEMSGVGFEDYGVDLIAKKGGTRMAVQCKRLAKAVGVAAVQQVVSGALHHGCDQTVVVTNQSFTKPARQLAGTHRCRLVAREQCQFGPDDVLNPAL